MGVTNTNAFTGDKTMAKRKRNEREVRAIAICESEGVRMLDVMQDAVDGGPALCYCNNPQCFVTKYAEIDTIDDVCDGCGCEVRSIIEWASF